MKTTFSFRRNRNTLLFPVAFVYINSSHQRDPYLYFKGGG